MKPDIDDDDEAGDPNSEESLNEHDVFCAKAAAGDNKIGSADERHRVPPSSFRACPLGSRCYSKIRTFGIEHGFSNKKQSQPKSAPFGFTPEFEPEPKHAYFGVPVSYRSVADEEGRKMKRYEVEVPKCDGDAPDETSTKLHNAELKYKCDLERSLDVMRLKKDKNLTEGSILDNSFEKYTQYPPLADIYEEGCPVRGVSGPKEGGRGPQEDTPDWCYPTGTVMTPGGHPMCGGSCYMYSGLGFDADACQVANDCICVWDAALHLGPQALKTSVLTSLKQQPPSSSKAHLNLVRGDKDTDFAARKYHHLAVLNSTVLEKKRLGDSGRDKKKGGHGSGESGIFVYQMLAPNSWWRQEYKSLGRNLKEETKLWPYVKSVDDERTLVKGSAGLAIPRASDVLTGKSKRTRENVGKFKGEEESQDELSGKGLDTAVGIIPHFDFLDLHNMPPKAKTQGKGNAVTASDTDSWDIQRALTFPDRLRKSQRMWMTRWSKHGKGWQNSYDKHVQHLESAYKEFKQQLDCNKVDSGSKEGNGEGDLKPEHVALAMKLTLMESVHDVCMDMQKTWQTLASELSHFSDSSAIIHKFSSETEPPRCKDRISDGLEQTTFGTAKHDVFQCVRKRTGKAPPGELGQQLFDALNYVKGGSAGVGRDGFKSFYLGEEGGMCPQGTTIRDAKTCQQAIRRLGVDVQQEKSGSDAEGAPPGCSYSARHTFISAFNDDFTRKNGGAYSPICYVKQNYFAIDEKTCPYYRLSESESLEKCKEAAQDLYGVDEVSEVKIDRYQPSGCVAQFDRSAREGAQPTAVIFREPDAEHPSYGSCEALLAQDEIKRTQVEINGKLVNDERRCEQEGGCWAAKDKALKGCWEAKGGGATTTERKLCSDPKTPDKTSPCEAGYRDSGNPRFCLSGSIHNPGQFGNVDEFIFCEKDVDTNCKIKPANRTKSGEATEQPEKGEEKDEE